MEYSIEHLRERHSVRSFLTESLSKEVRDTLRAEITMVNSHEAGLNLQLFFDDDAPLRGFTRSYGMFRNAGNYLAAVVDPTFTAAEERAAYFCERFVMKCVELGLGACFVSGTYSAAKVGARMEVYERLPFIVAFGIPDGGAKGLMQRIGRSFAGKRQPGDFYYDTSGMPIDSAKRLLPWLETGLEGMACAPSAMNRRPVRIKVTEKDGFPVVSAHCVKGDAPLDLGIAKYNFQAPLNVSGEWEWGENGQFVLFEE